MKKILFSLPVAAVLATTPAFADYKATELAMRTVGQMNSPMYEVHMGREAYLSATTGATNLHSFPYIHLSTSDNGKTYTINDSSSLKYKENWGQCVSLVKAMGNFSTVTADWKKSVRVTPNANNISPTFNLTRGDIIATFVGDNYGGKIKNKNGDYVKHAGHTGVFLGVSKYGMMIFDQNWDTKKPNVVMFHTIPFGPEPGKPGFVEGDINNAYAYFRVK